MNLNLCAQWLLQRAILQFSPGINLAWKPLATNLDCLEKFLGWQPQWSAVTAGCLHTWMPHPVRFKQRGNTSALLTCSECKTIGHGAFVYQNKKKKKSRKKAGNQTISRLGTAAEQVPFHLLYRKTLFYTLYKWLHSATTTTAPWCNTQSSLW